MVKTTFGDKIELIQVVLAPYQFDLWIESILLQMIDEGIGKWIERLLLQVKYLFFCRFILLFNRSFRWCWTIHSSNTLYSRSRGRYWRLLIPGGNTQTLRIRGSVNELLPCLNVRCLFDWWYIWLLINFRLIWTEILIVSFLIFEGSLSCQFLFCIACNSLLFPIDYEGLTVELYRLFYLGGRLSLFFGGLKLTRLIGHFALIFHIWICLCGNGNNLQHWSLHRNISNKGVFYPECFCLRLVWA